MILIIALSISLNILLFVMFKRSTIKLKIAQLKYRNALKRANLSKQKKLNRINFYTFKYKE